MLTVITRHPQRDWHERPRNLLNPTIYVRMIALCRVGSERGARSDAALGADPGPLGADTRRLADTRMLARPYWAIVSETTLKIAAMISQVRCFD